jgi:hypothetical protein
VRLNGASFKVVNYPEPCRILHFGDVEEKEKERNKATRKEKGRQVTTISLTD